jgi:hypothetical protein
VCGCCAAAQLQVTGPLPVMRCMSGVSNRQKLQTSSLVWHKDSSHAQGPVRRRAIENRVTFTVGHGAGYAYLRSQRVWTQGVQAKYVWGGGVGGMEKLP